MRLWFSLGIGCLLLAAPAVRAEQNSDYEAVQAAVSALNDPAARRSLFVPNAPGAVQLRSRLEWRAAPPPFLEPPSVGHWEVVISHEPMGEAQIVPVPGPVLAPPPPAVQRPIIVVRAIRFPSRNSARVDATIEDPAPVFGDYLAGNGSPAASMDVHLVMVRGDGAWRVASARFGKP